MWHQHKTSLPTSFTLTLLSNKSVMSGSSQEMVWFPLFLNERKQCCKVSAITVSFLSSIIGQLVPISYHTTWAAWQTSMHINRLTRIYTLTDEMYVSMELRTRAITCLSSNRISISFPWVKNKKKKEQGSSSRRFLQMRHMFVNTWHLLILQTSGLKRDNI